MKKIFLIVLILLLALFINEVIKFRGTTKSFTITDFSKPQTFVLKPKKNKGYTTFIIEIRGESNDSIAIFENQYVKLPSKVDTIFNPDYYGGIDAVFYFYPYKAKSGKFDVTLTIK